MERGIEGMEWMGSGPNPHEREPDIARAGLPDWGGTGLCAEAQADGIPCPALGRSCDTCGRITASRRERPDAPVRASSRARST
jgi:hypothetical protein